MFEQQSVLTKTHPIMHIKSLFPLVSSTLSQTKDAKTHKRLRRYFDVIREVIEDPTVSHQVDDLPLYISQEDWGGIAEACKLRCRSPSYESNSTDSVTDSRAPEIDAIELNSDRDVEEVFSMLRQYSNAVHERIVELHALRKYQHPTPYEWDILKKDLQDMQEQMEALKLSR